MKRVFFPYNALTFALIMSAITLSCAEDEYSEGILGKKITLGVHVTELKEDLITRGGESIVPPITDRVMEGITSPVYLKKFVNNEIHVTKGKLGADSIYNTRGRSINVGEFYENYGLITFEYGATLSWAADGATLTSTVYNEEVKQSRAWMTDEFWPGPTKKCAFFAYAPRNCNGVSINNSSSVVTGTPTMHFRCPDKVTDQKDLLICANEKDIPGNYNAIKKITFDHALTAIHIAIGNQMAPCRITNIKLKGVYREADYTFGGNWSNHSNTGDYSIGETYVIEDGESNRMITGGEYVFMMIPQTCPNDAQLEITINDGSEHTLRSSIGGDVWGKGTTVTYQISTAQTKATHFLTVQKPSSDISYSGSYVDYNVTSYKQTYYGTQVNVPWHATYQIDGGLELNVTNDTVTSFTASAGGSTGTPGYTFRVAKSIPMPVDDGNTHTATLRAASEKNGPYDLSQGGETANCYLVDAGGTYSLPLVYGNSRGNTGAYGSESFVDHMGEQITNPFIYNKYTPGDAVLVWEDQPDLVTNVHLSADKHSLIFDVPKATIRQGNAVVAVRDEGKIIMWSWHIWVTDYKQQFMNTSNAIVVKNDGNPIDKAFYFTEYPIGFCDREKRVFPERIFTINIYQDDPVVPADGLTASIQIKQEELEYETAWTATYFQWGRKDPIIPLELNRSERKYYYGDNTFKYTASSEGVPDDFRYTIQKPIMMFTGRRWSGTNRYDLWNVGAVTADPSLDAVTKSIYDPSPVGYTVPKKAAFTNLNNSRTDIWNNGRWCYTHGKNTGTLIFFHELGRINSDYSFHYNEGFYWTCDAGTNTDEYRWDARFNSSDVDVRGRDNIVTDCYPIRPTVNQ